MTTKNPQLKESYHKTISVIESCKTKNQLEGASRMVENFKTLYKNVDYPKVLSYIIDKTLKEQYIKI